MPPRKRGWGRAYHPRNTEFRRSGRRGNLNPTTFSLSNWTSIGGKVMNSDQTNTEFDKYVYKAVSETETYRRDFSKFLILLSIGFITFYRSMLSIELIHPWVIKVVLLLHLASLLCGLTFMWLMEKKIGWDNYTQYVQDVCNPQALNDDRIKKQRQVRYRLYLNQIFSFFISFFLFGCALAWSLF